MPDDAAGLFDAPSEIEQERMVEALLFASPTPLSLRQISERLPQGSDPAPAVARLILRYDGRGVRLERVGDAFAFRTAADLGWLMRREQVETKRLSRAGMETLAIVAYHQPVTRAEIEEMRGVAVSKGTLDLLIDLAWIRLGRRRQSPGRPVTFVTTQAFLDHFGLESPRDLPGLRELREAGLIGGRAAEGAEPPRGDDTGDMFV